MNDFASIERRRIELKKMMDAENQRHQSALKGIRDEMLLNEERANIMNGGLDESLIILASHILSVGGNYKKAGGEVASQLNEAIARIIDGGEKLRHEFIAVKDYAHWQGQATNHGYGYGPKHGYITFRIGLTELVRQRIQTPLLTDEEINACVYYLRNIERIQAASEEAKKLVA